MVTMPALDGVDHKFVDLGGAVTIHVADAGPADGPPVMLVHGFPENWWEWHELIGPLAADGYRVLCPDLRGAGWSSAPRSRYLKNEMADDLAAVLDQLGVGPVNLVAHDWGGPVAFIMMLRHPAKVTGFFGVNTVAPYVQRDLKSLRNIWRFWYQIPMALPVIGPRVIGDRKARFSGCWGPGSVAGSCCPRTTSPCTPSACASPGTPWPARGGIGRFRPRSPCAGCAASSITLTSASPSAG